MGRRRKTDHDQGDLPFASDSDADDHATRKPRRKRKAPPPADPGAWPNCAAGLHRLCAVEVMPNKLPLVAIRCGCLCHKETAPGSSC